MKLYKNGNDYATWQIDETWQEIDDEIVETPIGTQLKSYTLTPEYQQKLSQYQKFLQIEQLKKQLKDTDYLAIKNSEGLISDEDYAPMKAQRQAWREQINELEEQL